MGNPVVLHHNTVIKQNNTILVVKQPTNLYQENWAVGNPGRDVA